jgi:hypothetical protein
MADLSEERGEKKLEQASTDFRGMTLNSYLKISSLIVVVCVLIKLYLWRYEWWLFLPGYFEFIVACIFSHFILIHYFPLKM